MKEEDVMKYPVINSEKTGKNIKKIISRSGMKMDDVMNYLGIVERSSLYRWFRGERIPSLETLLALSVLLGISVNDIVVID